MKTKSIAVLLALVLLGSSVAALGYLYLNPQPQPNQTVQGGYMSVMVNYIAPDGVAGSTVYTSNQQPIGQTFSMTTPYAVGTMPAGSTITSVNTNLVLTPTYTLTAGTTITGYSIGGTFSTAMFKAASTAPYADSGSALYTSSPIAMVKPSNAGSVTGSGKEVIVTSVTTPADSILNAAVYTGWQNGQYYNWKMTANSPSMTLQFSDGTSLSKTASSITFVMTFVYGSSNSFTGLTARFDVSYT